MIQLKKPHGYWTKERCQEEALNYSNRSDFSDNNSSAYTKALKNGWLDEIYFHFLITQII